MRFLVRALFVLVVLAVLGLGGGWFLAGRQPGPVIVVQSPTAFIGQAGTLAFSVETPAAELTALDVVLEQNGQSMPVLTLADAGDGAITQTEAGLLQVSKPIGKKAQPALANGNATLRITAVRSLFFGLRSVQTTETRDLQVRLDPPRVSVVSLHHFVNLGGAEFAVLRVTPEDVQAGIRVGDAVYPAYPGAGAGLAEPALRVVFFALRYDQPVNTPITAFARDGAGNEASTRLEHQPFNKVYQKSRIPIDQRFLDRVVPAIAASTPDLSIDTSSPAAMLQGFLTINGELRRKNAETIIKVAASSTPDMLWRQAFSQPGNSQVESRFADQRTYFFEDKEIDRQVHLGFDLASVQQAPVAAANDGVIAFVDFLGIYGNCIIIDHGLGVQSLYAHLSSVGVKVGDRVQKGAELGRTGITGLAGGDHLHFSMLLQGTPVNSVEWWDPHWMEDRVFRKIREAGGSVK